MRPEEIIIAPVITEKSNDGLNEGKYTFEVNRKATKIDIKNAVEKLFNVKVLKVENGKISLSMKALEEVAPEEEDTSGEEVVSYKDEGDATTGLGALLAGLKLWFAAGK